MALHNPDIARLAAVWAIVEPVFAKPHAELTLAHVAELVACASAFGLIALHADDFFSQHCVLSANYIPRAA